MKKVIKLSEAKNLLETILKDYLLETSDFENENGDLDWDGVPACSDPDDLNPCVPFDGGDFDGDGVPACTDIDDTDPTIW
jgi:hypothetical protein